MLAGAWIAIVACSSEYTGSRSTECSSGPPYGNDNYPPPAKASESRTIPECVPRCGGEQKYDKSSYGPLYSLAALPAGACVHDDERCQMTAGSAVTCRGATRICDVSLFECVCTDGAWRCFVTAQGAGVCPCTDLDASADGPSSG